MPYPVPPVQTPQMMCPAFDTGNPNIGSILVLYTPISPSFFPHQHQLHLKFMLPTMNRFALKCDFHQHSPSCTGFQTSLLLPLSSPPIPISAPQAKPTGSGMTEKLLQRSPPPPRPHMSWHVSLPVGLS